MFDDFLKFLKNLRKEKKTGITATDQAEKKLQEAAKNGSELSRHVVVAVPLMTSLLHKHAPLSCFR